MNRRNFIKRGAIWCPAIVGLKAYPQALTLADPAGVTAAPKTLTCQLLAEQTVDNAYWATSTGAIAQRVKFSGGTVCQIDLKIRWQTDGGKVKVECWSNADRTGTQYGSASNEIETSQASFYPAAAWGTFTFATKPAPPGDFWICLVQTGTGDTQWRMDYNHASGATWYPFTNSTDDQNYCAYSYGANRSTTDFCFKLYTDQ